MTPDAPAPRSGPPARLLDRLVLIFPVFLVLGIMAMIWSLQSSVDKPPEHPSVGIFHPGEYATENGISGTVDLVLTKDALGYKWFVTIHFVDQEAQPIPLGTVYGHSVESGRYGDLVTFTMTDPGTWTGTLILLDSVKSVMIHLDVPGGQGEEWIAEWTPKGGLDAVAPALP